MSVKWEIKDTCALLLHNHLFGCYFCFQQSNEWTHSMQWGLCKKTKLMTQKCLCVGSAGPPVACDYPEFFPFLTVEMQWNFSCFLWQISHRYYPFALSRLLHILAVLINRNLQACLVFGMSQTFRPTLISTTHTVRTLSLGVSSSKVCGTTGIYCRIFIGIRKPAAAVPSTDTELADRAPEHVQALIPSRQTHSTSRAQGGEVSWLGGRKKERMTDEWDAHAAVIATIQTTTLQPFQLLLKQKWHISPEIEKWGVFSSSKCAWIEERRERGADYT